MKSLRRIALGAAIIAVIFAAGCKTGSTQRAGQMPQQGGQARQAAEMTGTQGVITQVSAASITIAVMPESAMLQRDMGLKPYGTGVPDKASGTRPSGSGAENPSATRDTSSWEKKTYAIDSATKIMQLGGLSGSNSTALTVNDLEVGGIVSIEESAGNAGTAGAITVLRGMGGGPGGPAPDATAKS